MGVIACKSYCILGHRPPCDPDLFLLRSKYLGYTDAAYEMANWLHVDLDRSYFLGG